MQGSRREVRWVTGGRGGGHARCYASAPTKNRLTRESLAYGRGYTARKQATYVCGACRDTLVGMGGYGWVGKGTAGNRGCWLA